jgi:hypothetical protein
MFDAAALDCTDAVSTTAFPAETVAGDALADVTWYAASAGAAKDVDSAAQSQVCRMMNCVIMVKSSP